jgi:hypothetical protein
VRDSLGEQTMLPDEDRQLGDLRGWKDLSELPQFVISRKRSEVTPKNSTTSP